MFARALATHGKCNFVCVTPKSVLDSYFGNTEKNISGIFDLAKEKAVELDNTTVLFFDEIDGLIGKPGTNDCKTEEQIIKIFQVALSGANEPKGKVVVVGATNYPDRLPEAILSRFSQIEVFLPDHSERVQILKLHLTQETQNLRSELDDTDYNYLGRLTDGASGRDIRRLVKNAMKERRLPCKNYDGWWCRDSEGYFVPCSCDRGEKKKLNDRDKKRMPPLSLRHFEKAIEESGVLSVEKETNTPLEDEEM